MKALFVCTAVLFPFAIAGTGQADDGFPYQQKQDVVYAEVHGTGLLMDVFTPTGKPNGLAIVDVASGAWSSDRGKIRDHTLAQLYTIFCSRGYVVFAARPGSKSRYPVAEMDQNVKTAIRYVKQHAPEYKIDPARLGLTGASAGGHLATLAALTPAMGDPAAKKPLDRHDTTVRAVAVFFPPTDFLDWGDGKMLSLNVLAPLLFVGGVNGRSEEEIKEAARAVSPLYRVTKPSAPFLLIHGDADQVVPLSHSQKLAKAITQAGGSAELIIKPGGGHPWLTLPEEVRVMADWFDKQLGSTPIFEGLGSFQRDVTTSSVEAQRYFSQGLCFLYAFNHDEAIRSFRRSAELDPNCAMARWGIAVANGPHINNPFVSPEKAQAAWESLTKAHELATGSSEIEQALIDALSKRYSNPSPEDRKPLDADYAAAMRRVWKRFPDDADVGALFAESLMDLRPWDLWTPDGKPQPGTEEIVETLEAVFVKKPNHPLALHLYIHAVEASPHPEKAEAAANRLRDLQPGLGHLVHMPSHIDVRRGHWARAIEANTKAIAADQSYRQKTPRQDFYHVYMAHNHHMLAFAAMMRGQSRLAVTTMNEMVQGIPPGWLRDNAAIADGFTAMPLEVLVRFGRWEEVLAAPEPPVYLPLARCLRHGARGIAYAALGNVESAQAEQQSFLRAKSALPPDRTFGNNKAADLLAVAEHLLASEILYRTGKVDAGITALREAVAREDQLRYSEPPDWIHPVRHALGATLLQEKRAQEAEKVYREDLAKLPENVWSLFGLARSLRLQGKDQEATEWESRFQKACGDADVIISSSCFCQRER